MRNVPSHGCEGGGCIFSRVKPHSISGTLDTYNTGTVYCVVNTPASISCQGLGNYRKHFSGLGKRLKANCASGPSINTHSI